MKANKLLVLLAVAVVAITLVFLVDSSDPDVPENLADKPEEPTQGDLPQDTLNTLAAQISSMNDQITDLQQSDAQPQTSSQEAVEDTKKSNPIQSAIDSLRADIDQQLAQLKDPASTTQADPQPVSQLPNLKSLPDYQINAALAQVNQQTQSMWIGPIDGTQAKPVLDLLPDLSNGGTASDPEPVPVYTIPRNAVLTDARALTALVGRVPFQGVVDDPYPVRIISGRDAILASGHHYPENLDQMIWSGTASGDWALSCVRIALESVTFIFDDGSISTFEDKKLGSISDPFGLPCVRGEKVTNAAPALATRFMTGAIEAAAQGYAQAQVTTTNSGSGVTTAIDDALAFGGYKALAGGTRDIRSWIDQRMGQVFDAIFVEPGADVSIHLDLEIPIDYNPKRKVSHDEVAITILPVLD